MVYYSPSGHSAYILKIGQITIDIFVYGVIFVLMRYFFSFCYCFELDFIFFFSAFMFISFKLLLCVF